MTSSRFPQVFLLSWVLFALAACGGGGESSVFSAQSGDSLASSDSTSSDLPVNTETVDSATVTSPPPPNNASAADETPAPLSPFGDSTSVQFPAPDDAVETAVNDEGSSASDEGSGSSANQNIPANAFDNKLIDPESWNYEEVHTKAGYELVFSDEFNGREVNPDRWNTQLRWDGEFNGLWYEYRIINDEAQFYVNTLTPDGEHRDKLLQPGGFNPFRFDGSQLAIRATANPFVNSREPTQLDQNGRDISFGRFEPLLKRQPFLSGVLASYDKFSQKYGYFEARIRLPAHTGTFPAFWLHHQRLNSENTQRSEIDIMENLGHAPGVIYNTFHYFDYVSIDNPGQGNLLKPEPSGGRVTVGGNFSDNYHVYAVDWRPGSIVWLIDGQPVGWLSNPEVDFEEMYVIMNLAIGGEWINFPVFAGGLGRGETEYYPTIDEQDPAVFGNPEVEIDYIRVYRHTP